MPALDRGIIIGRRTCAPLVLLAAALKASPAAAALLPSPGDKSGLWAAVDPRTLATTSILLSLAAAALLLAFGLISARRSAARLLAGQQSQFIALQADIDRAEGLLEAQGQLSIVYGPGGISLHGSLAGIENLPREASAIANFRAWIEPATAAALEQALARLRAGGEGFATMIRTSDGERLEALGRTAGGLPVLILRAISADRLEQMRLHERLAALESEAAGLRDLLDSVPAPAWIRDENGTLRWVNSAYARALGCNGSGEALASARELFDPETCKAVAGALAQSARHHRTASINMSGSATGERTTFEISAVRLGKGEAGLAQNVSETEALRDDMSRLIDSHARTLDQINTAVAIFGADTKLRFANAAYRKLWQLDAKWLDSAPTDGEILDRLRSAERLPEQPDYRKWKAQQLKSYSSLEPSRQLWHLPDGQTLRAVAEPHPQGGVTYLYDDVTETLALKSRHTAMMKVQSETLDNLAEGVALFTSDGRLRLYNAAFARMWRLPVADLDAGPRIDQLIAWSRALVDDAGVWSRIKGRITALGDARQTDTLRLERADQSVVDCLLVPLPGGDTLVTYVDVTDTALAERALRERNEALEQASKIKSAFIRHVSYVLRAPLTTITGYTDLLAREATGPLNDKQREYAGHVLSSSHSLLAIINDILDLATIDAGTMELELAPVSIDEIMRTAAQGLEDRIRQADLTLELAESGDIGTFLADGKRLTQILFNLVSNAISHSNPGGSISVTCSREDDEVRLEVADQGRGIPPEMQEVVFERFESLAPGAGQRGAGLGLSLVKSLVELHGGEVQLRSVPGQGTTITCIFPISPQAAARRRQARQILSASERPERQDGPAPDGLARPAAAG
ncbi:MAG TPA: ATP-binding protein [Hyphomicrobiales bacterium]|nr:PAS-domain containing protein [Rhodobiaceae bacterium]HXK53326.1 ATP-binding protein [Hyphomicrobiales bacterium]